MIKRFYILLLAIVASVGMSLNAGTVTWDQAFCEGVKAYKSSSSGTILNESNTKGGITVTFSGSVTMDGLESGAIWLGDGSKLTFSSEVGDILNIEVYYDFKNYYRQGYPAGAGWTDDTTNKKFVWNGTAASVDMVKGSEDIGISVNHIVFTIDGEPAPDPAGSSITINESSHGSVVASPTSAEAGETITLTATPDDGYQLKSISGVYVPVSETLNATSETVNGNKFQAQATSRNNNGWRVYNPGTANTLTVSSLNGTTLITKIEFTSTWGGQRKNNMLSVSAGTLSFDGNDPSTIVTINGINATSVTISGSGTNAGQTWCITSVKVYYEGTDEEELEISDTENANVKTFTMVDSEVTISAEFEAVAPAPAGTVTVVFEANNNQKEVEVTLPHTFACDFQNGNGELDGIIQELYALQYGGYCPALSVPTATGNEAVTASKDGNNHYIAISEAFEGTATVTGNYIKYLDTEHMGNSTVDYTLTISVQGSDPAPTPTPMGDKLSGAFSIGGGKKVYFSRGNLQATYDGSNWTWGFAEHQYDRIGNAAANNTVNGLASIDGTGTVDLFGWSSKNRYYGIDNSTEWSDYGSGFKSSFVDWGNTVGGDWRTLTTSEWRQIVAYRTNAADLRAMATVDGIRGLILMPDNWTASGISLAVTMEGYTDNQLTISQWETLESQGCVFLPAGGIRVYQYGYYDFNENFGSYWAAPNTTGEAESGQCMYFPTNDPGDAWGNVNVSTGSVPAGHSVRLVSETAPAASLADVIALINEIPNPAVLTAECKEKIDAARAAFDGLSDGDKDLVTNIATLTTAEAAFENVMNIWLSGDCDVILWNDTTLTVRKHAGEGNGAMADYSYASRAPWYSAHWYSPQPNDIVIKSVTIENGVTHLGDYAFAWMSEMKTVTIPSSVTTIPDDAFYWSKAVDDIYLSANPSNLQWMLPTSADAQFKPEKATLCHVPVDLLPVYQEWFNTVNVTYVGDQAPTVLKLEVGRIFNDSDEVYLGPDTTYIQFNCFASGRYFYGKGTFKIIGDEFVEGEVFGIKFEPKSMSYCFMKYYSNGKSSVSYGTNCCTTARPTQMTVVSGDGTKDNPFVIEPDTKGECIQAAFSTLPQAADGLLFDMTEKTLITAGVVNAGRVQYSLDNGANWSDELPKATDPGTYKVHYRVLGGNSCVLGIDYNENNFVEATIASDPNVVVWDSTFVKQVSTYRSNAGYNFNKHNVKDGITAFFEGTQVFNGFFGDELYFSGPSALLTFTHEAGKIAKAEFYGTITATSVTEYNGWVWDADNNKLVWEGTPDATISIQGQASGSGHLDVKYVTYMIFTLVPPTPEEVMALINAIGTVEYTAECKQKIDLARKTYERLVGEVAKAAVTNYSTLTQAETDFATLQSAAVQNAIDKIAAIPTPVVYTEACGNAIDAARAAYNALLEADMSQIPEASVTKLTEAENTYANLAAADPVITKIDNIPFPVEATLATRDSINNARAAYDALTAAQKAVVSNYQKLLDAEAALAGLMPPASLPEGALSGKFTINAAGDQIMFAKGNLQATTTDLGATWTWGFATNQWDTIGCAGANTKITGNGTVSENGTVDLFGWSTEATYYGINKSTSSDTYTGGVLKDWGENITSAEWRTLTQDEWKYVLQIRINDKNLRGQATVNGMKGYILLPDNWELPTGSSFTPMPNNWTANVYEGDEWTAMENAGAVFLPIAPRRSGVKVQMQTTGSYWTATKFGSSDSGSSSWMFQILEDFAKTDMSSRYYGYPVRLTMPAVNTNPFDSAQAVKELIDAIPVPVTLNDSSAIYAAREAFDALSDWAKNAIDAATVQKLTDAETALNTLLVQGVIDMINALPNPMTEATTKLSVYTQASEVRAAYDALTPAQKAVVSNIDILEAVEAVFDAIASSGGSGETVIQWDKNTGIAYVGNNTTSPAYEHMTVTTGNGSMFSVFMQARLSFGFNSQPNGGFTFANVDGYNLTKVEIKSTTALTSTMQEVDRMGSGWVISNENKTATWTGNADSVSIWKGQSFTNYWYTDTILFTIATPSNPIMNAFAAVDKINLIPTPVTLEDACVNAIKDARAAVDSLYAHKSLIDDPDMLKLTNAEAALLALNQAEADKVITKINNIPTPVELKLATRDSIEGARAAYDALNADQQALVTNYQDLLDAEAALAAINPGGAGMPAGALSGKFAINADGDQIAFAKGNLQATTTDLGEHWTWGFAANQWEVIGNAAANNAVNGNRTVSENGTVDLFGWSTPMTYYGIHNSTNADYYSDDFREWGENITGATWKTPSPSDWIYIIYDRADAAQKQGQATVNGVNGYIFLPDEWVLPTGLSFTAKPNNWTANVYDGDDWTAMENAGAVFLPKSSWRKGNTVTALAYGYYWSSDYNNYSNATAYYFKEDLTITATGIPRYAGIYVRLVTADVGSSSPLDSAQHVKDLIDAIPVPVTLSSKDAIDAARNAFDALAEATQNALDATTVQKLTDAEDAYAQLIQAATDVIALINAIPQPVVYNEACGDSITAARNAYDALSDELKPLVTNYNVLTDAEDTYAALAPRIWTSGDCQVVFWPGDSAMIVSKLPGEGNGVMDNYAKKDSVPWKEYQLKVKTLTIESGVTEIGKCAFYDLRNLAGDLVIPEGVTAIHENGFRNCLKLTSITLPSTITLLGDNADSFNNCKATDVYITADPNKLAWNEDFDDFIYSYAQASVHKTTVCHVPADFYEIYVAKFDETVNVTFVGDLSNALSEAEHQAIDAVKDSIAAIGAEISYPESGAAIDAARSAYDALDDDLKPFVSNYQTLLDAEDAYADAKQAHDAVAYAAIDKINAIPVPVEYSSKPAIDTARVAYDALLDTQKALVPDSILQKLTDAEAAWAAIAEKVEHNVSYMGKDGELKNEIVALLNIPDPAPDFNGYEFVRWDVKAGDFLEEGLRIKAVYTPIITTNPQGFDTLAYNGLAQELVKAGEAKEGHIEYSLQPDEPESWSANLPTATNAGVYAIYYKLVREGHEDYIAPEPTMATIAKVPVTYVAPIAYDTLVYTAAAQTLVIAGQTNDGSFEYTLTPADAQSWKTAVPQGYAAGSYGVYYKVQGDINHLDSIIAEPIAVSIAKAELKATADDKSVIYGDLAPQYTVTYTGWQGDDDATVLTGDIAFACEYAKGSPVGEYVITPSGVDAANYTITFVNGKVTVNRKSAKSDDITAKQADNEKLVYTAAVNKPTIQAKDTTKTLIEGTDYQLTFIGRGITEYAESVNAPIHVGEYTAIVDFIGNYKDTLTVDFVINKAPLTITAEDKEITFGELAPEFTVSYEGFLGTDTATVLTGVQAYACEYVRGNNVGEYTIIPSGVEAHDYAIAFGNGTLTVNRKSAKSADIAAKQADNETLVYDAEVNRPTIQVKDTTLVLTEAQDYVLTFKGVAADQSTYAECETAPTHVGNYTAIVAFIGNYIDTLTVDFVINKAPLTITANDTAMIYGDIAPEFTVSYNGWFGNDDESVILGTQAYDCIYAPGSPIGTYAITPKGVEAYDYAITFVDGTLTVNKAHVYVSDAEAQIAKFADGHANAVVLKQGTLNGIKVNDPIAHVTTAAFSSADVAEHLTITLFYELTGDAALLNNYYLDPTSDIFTNEGVIIEPFIPDNEEKPEDEEATVNEGIEIYAYGYCDGSGYSLKYHLESGNPDQYKIDFDDSRFTDVDWTNLVITGKDGTIDIDIPVDLPTGDYTMTVYFRDSRFDWLESRQFNVTFHVNLPETYVRPLFDNVIALVDTCHCLTDIQWYWRANSTDLWQPIEGANGYYYHVDGKLTGEYFVSAKMNGEPTYTCGQADMETLYGAGQQAEAPVVRAYPNPVVNSTTVTIENSIEWIHNIRIVNLMGVEVMNDTFEGDKTSVEMGHYPQGNYMISVDGIVVKVMKQ